MENLGRLQVSFKSGPNAEFDLDMNIYLVDQNNDQFDELAIDAMVPS